jgi:L-2-hydroxyglutarate oxidase
VSLGVDVKLSGGHVIANDHYVSPRHTLVAAGTGFNGLCPHRAWRVLGFRGAYREVLAPKVERLVYAVPDPRYPFLGVHLTPTLDGRVLAGPNATMTSPFVLGRGTMLAARNWRMGLHELATRARPSAMRDEIRRYVPDAEIGTEVVASGVRAQAVDARGGYADDFILLEDPGVTWVANAPSPGATACLAIGERLAERIAERLR